MNVEDLAWFAGIVDGEGCFSLRASIGKTKTMGKRVRFGPQLSVTNTNKKIIEKAASIFPVDIKERKSKELKNKNLFVITYFANALRIILPLILPYLVKKEECEIVQRACVLTQSHKVGWVGKWGRKPLYREDIVKLTEMRKQLQNLHGRQAIKLLKINPDDYIISDVYIKPNTRPNRRKIKLRDLTT